ASGCTDAPTCVGCAAPRYSALDNCFTHDDRDFVLDLAVGEEALPFLSPANMIADSAHAGRDLDVEAEWMYLFAPFHSVRLFASGDDRRARRPALALDPGNVARPGRSGTVPARHLARGAPAVRHRQSGELPLGLSVARLPRRGGRELRAGERRRPSA